MKSLYDLLTADFPQEAYQIDSSRGFDLSTLRAQYIVERLNEVFGLNGWRLAGDYEEKDGGVIFHGDLIINLTRAATGYSANKKNMGDTYKSAKTDCLSKAASLLGVGNEMFKGLIQAGGKPQKFNSKGSNGQSGGREYRTGSDIPYNEQMNKDKPAPKPRDPNSPITEKQLKRLFVLLKKNGFTQVDVKHYMGIDSFQLFPKGQYNAVCDLVEAKKLPRAPDVPEVQSDDVKPSTEIPF